MMATTGETSTQLALRDPDIRLMLRVREDQPGAFEELVELYQHRLVAVMNHLVGNATEAEDLTAALRRVAGLRDWYAQQERRRVLTAPQTLAAELLADRTAGAARLEDVDLRQ